MPYRMMVALGPGVSDAQGCADVVIQYQIKDHKICILFITILDNCKVNKSIKAFK